VKGNTQQEAMSFAKFGFYQYRASVRIRKTAA
jgi:hypothetical protein